MNPFAWIKSLFKPPVARPDLVRFFDPSSERVVHIPAAELRPGCVQARVQGIDGVVWVLAEDLQEGPIRHPPFDEETRSCIAEIQAAFAEHRDLTVDGWEDGFRRDLHAMREIAGFLYAADVYRMFTQDDADPVRRADVYRLLIGCMTTSPDSVWHVVQLQSLSRPDAERIVRRFYGGEKADQAEQQP